MRTTPYAENNEELREENCYHEAGHYVVAKNRGASGVHSTVAPNGMGGSDYYSVSHLDDAVALAAGSEAANLLYFHADMGITEGDASILPSVCRDAGITVEEARTKAREDVEMYTSEILQVARHLDQHGSIGW